MACIIEKTKPWPSNEIAFEIDDNVFPNGSLMETDINDAINEINMRTNVRFIQRTNELDFLYFTDGEGCSTKAGYRRNSTTASGTRLPYKHEINCDLQNDFSSGNIIHEIGHALGLWHEQSRQDRDDYICVRFDRIQGSSKTQFHRKLKDGIDYGLYDYSSIMHYSKNAFSTNWEINKQILDQKSKASPYNR